MLFLDICTTYSIKPPFWTFMASLLSGIVTF